MKCIGLALASAHQQEMIEFDKQILEDDGQKP